MKPPLYLIDIPYYGNSDIRLLTKAEQASMNENYLGQFEFWRHDGSRRFWAHTEKAETFKRHGFSMKDQYSKDHGCHVSDFKDLGNGVYESYEGGFEQADMLIKDHGSFLYFCPIYSSWGSNGCQVLPPTTDLHALLPPYFVNLIASSLSDLKSPEARCLAVK